jgi:hypothetical protein
VVRVQGCGLISKQGLGAGLSAVRFLCCVGAKQTKQGFGLSYNQRLGYGAVGGCGAGISYIQALAWCLAWCKEKG